MGFKSLLSAQAEKRERLVWHCAGYFLGFVTAPVVMLLQGVSYQGDDPASSVLAMYGAFINNVLITMFFVLGCVFLRRGWQRYTGLITVLIIAATTHFAQFRLLAICALAALLGAPGRIVTLGLISALTASYLLGISHVPEAMVTSPNSGIRLAFVADALSAVADTSGIGIGYGKESVRWRYRFPNMPDFTFLPDPVSITPDRMLEILSTGVHNSFVQALLRTGVVSFLLFLAAFFAAFPPRELPRDLRNHAAVVFWMAFLACFVNPALESPVQVVGVGFIYGYLLALRGWAGARHLALTRKVQQ